MIYMFDTQISLVSFSILLLEFIFLFIQLVYFLSRPSEKVRKWYLFLILFLLYYNICTIFYPNPDFKLSMVLQYVLAYSGGIPVSMYFTFYLHKVYKLQELKFFAFKGPVFFILLPFLFLFLVPYFITQNIELARTILVIVPSVYIMFFIYRLIVALSEKLKMLSAQDKSFFRLNIVAILLAIFFWITLPVWTILGPNYQDYELIATNTGFIIFTLLYTFNSIRNAKHEYRKLVKSESELKKINEKLEVEVNNKTRHLSQLNDQVTNNFSYIAHEAKTPLSVILNYLIDQKESFKDQDEYQIILRNVYKIINDINNFFDRQLIKQGKIRYNHHQVTNLSQLLNEQVQLYQLNEKRILVEIENDLQAKGAPDAFTRIFRNLIDNAVKYSKGNIEISLISKENAIQFTISDEGPGISIAQQIRIFEPFSRISHENAYVQGIGMGLYIVKSIVDEMDGKIQLLSKPGEGVKIFIELPQPKVSAGSYANEISNLEIPLVAERKTFYDVVLHPDQPSILLIEDSQDLLNYLIKHLKDNFNIFPVESAKAALEKLKEMAIPDLIISDIMMDDLDGMRFHQILQNNPKLSHIPFIYITARNDKDLERKGLSNGAIHYITKPFAIQDLKLKIDSILKLINNNNDRILKELISNSANHVAVKEKPNYGLSQRESEVAALIIKGCPNKEIADKLFIADNTVAKHIRHIFEKTGAKNRTELVGLLR